MGVSVNWVSFLWVPFDEKAVLFEIYVRAPVFFGNSRTDYGYGADMGPVAAPVPKCDSETIYGTRLGA